MIGNTRQTSSLASYGSRPLWIPIWENNLDESVLFFSVPWSKSALPLPPEGFFHSKQQEFQSHLHHLSFDPSSILYWVCKISLQLFGPWHTLSTCGLRYPCQSVGRSLCLIKVIGASIVKKSTHIQAKLH